MGPFTNPLEESGLQNPKLMSTFSNTINPSLILNFSTALIASKDWVCLPPSGLGEGPLFPWICWFIWKARNRFIFEEHLFTPSETITKAVREARKWQLAQQEKRVVNQRPNLSNRTPNQPHALTCFTDGAWNKETKIGGLGWILVDNEGSEVSRGQAAERNVSSPLMTEALAVRSALNHALEEGFTSLHLKSDALDLIRALNSHEQIKEIYGLLFDIHALASMFVSIDFSYIPRSNNNIADAIAKLAKSRLIPSLPTGTHCIVG
ncbi:unnamed protein product [Microthlaspi erraticum]|uniref:RNase H type-1 domain-containing protein n=1 Tax=Microthlaspi erraticum TaxID=1685480 RepID=A0A6D2HZR3_9BRAS|nr:unnamed protein product [Microthlaspi erraticum]